MDILTTVAVLALVVVASGVSIVLIRRERKRRNAVAEAQQEVLDTYQPFREAMDDLTTTAYDTRISNYRNALLLLHRASNHDQPAAPLVASTARHTLPDSPDAKFERGKIEFYFDFLRDIVWPKKAPSFTDALAAHQRQSVNSTD